MSNRTAPTPETVEVERLPRIIRAMAVVERVGNKLPHPFWLFWILAAILAVASAVLAGFDVTVVSPSDGETVAVRNLLSGDGLAMALSTMITNFAEFPPMATIVVVIMGVAVAERTGFLAAAMKVGVSRVPAAWVVFAVAFTGTVSHVASAAAYIILVPLGGLAFRAVGRSPILGIVVAYTSIASGYDASPVPTPNDAIFAGITTAAARIVDEDAQVSAVSNWFFNIASSILLAAVITLVTKLVLSKRPDLDPDPDADLDDIGSLELAVRERHALRSACLTLLVALIAIAVVVAPSGSPLRGEGGSLAESPFIDGIAAVVAFLFLLTGVVYGTRSGSITKAADVPRLMGEGIKQMAPVLVLFFAIAQFLAYFDWSRIGDVLAVESAQAARPEQHPGAGDLPDGAVPAGRRERDGHQRVGDVVDRRTGDRADADAPVGAGGDHAGPVPHRRLGLDRDHADEPVLRDGAGLPPALPQGRRHRHARVVHAPAGGGHDRGLDRAVLRVVGARHPARPGSARALSTRACA